MNDQFTFTQSPMQRSPSTIGEQPIPQKSPEKPKIKWVFIIVLILILFIMALIFMAGAYTLFQQAKKSPEEPKITTIIVTPTPNPTPIRQQTDISTTPAFISLEDAIASFSQKLIEFSKDDPSLNPPSLVLPLGLQ